MLLCCVCSTLCHSPLPLSLNRVSQSCMTPRLGVFCPCHRRTVADVYCHIPALWRAREHQLRPQVWQVPCSLSHFSSPEASVFVSAFLFFFFNLKQLLGTRSHSAVVWTEAERATCLPPQEWHHALLKLSWWDNSVC